LGKTKLALAKSGAIDLASANFIFCWKFGELISLRLMEFIPALLAFTFWLVPSMVSPWQNLR
jgi:hypothetical protein